MPRLVQDLIPDLTGPSRGLFSTRHIEVIHHYGLLPKYTLLLEGVRATDEIILYRLLFDATLIITYEEMLKVQNKKPEEITTVLSIADGSAEDTFARSLVLTNMKKSIGLDTSVERVEKANQRLARFAHALGVNRADYPCFSLYGDALKMDTPRFISPLDRDGTLDTFDLIILKHPDPYDWLSHIEEGIAFARFLALVKGILARLKKEGIFLLFLDQDAWIMDEDYFPFYELICKAGFHHLTGTGTLFGLLGIETNKESDLFDSDKLHRAAANQDHAFIGRMDHLKRLAFFLKECQESVNSSY